MSSGNHSFSPLVATIIGVKKAVVLQHFEFLQQSFITEKVSIKKVWVRRSVKALTATYPYMTPKEIRGCLDGLVKDGYLDTIVNNGSSTDHTKSYQLTEKGWNLIGQPKEISDLPAGAKGLPAGANRLHKRANLNIVSSNQFIIHREREERFAPPAPGEIIETVEEEKNENGLVAPPPAESAAPVPTHMITDIRPESPHTRVVSPFVMPARVDTVDEAEEIIMAWATADGRESVRKWYAEAARNCTANDVREMVGKFAGVYLTIGDEGKRQRMAQDPLQFFKYTFKVFLKNQKQFDAPAQSTQKPTYGQHAQPNQPSPKNYMPSYS